LLVVLAIATRASAGNPSVELTLFDAPGAGTAPGLGTFPFDINVWGEVAGYYNDANNVSHGFLRAVDGAFTTFDAADGGEGTTVWAVNIEGEVAGFSVTDNGIPHGFVRAAMEP